MAEKLSNFLVTPMPVERVGDGLPRAGAAPVLWADIEHRVEEATTRYRIIDSR